MRLCKVEVENFRLLHRAALLLEPKTTVIVGRNNSGKTSLTEVLKRILDDGSVVFRLEDFSFQAHEEFWQAFKKSAGGADDQQVRATIPAICVRLYFQYEKNETLGPIGDFVIDIDDDCTETIVHVIYRPKDGSLKSLFADLIDTSDAAKPGFFAALRERISAAFGTETFAVDPNDANNKKTIDLSDLRKAVAGNFIFAQRGLDDISHKDRVVIGKVLENLFTTAKLNAEDKDSYTTAQELELAVRAIQEKIGVDFNKKLDVLLPTFSMFGYPGLSGQALLTETTFDVARLLTNNTKVRYSGSNGVHLPEAYNGLGARNIILMLLQLREFFKGYLASETKPAVHVIFIEEPEVHLHPQMQEVFIRKLSEIAEAFGKETKHPWPVQFVVSTHSSHIANEAHFETIRYFLSKPDNSGLSRTIIKDLRKGLSGKPEPDRTFLHQYMTLTRCDLFFADKAILIEGTTERLLLPRMIEAIDGTQPEKTQLSSQYVSVIEVGGAYAHLFFDLIDFLELRSLIITDIDTVRSDGGKMKACHVTAGEASSNACIKSWFQGSNLVTILGATDEQKTLEFRRIAFQVPESPGGPRGRSFEDAFMLANEALFTNEKTTVDEKEQHAYGEAKCVKKSQFALDHALSVAKWNTPLYIQEGLLWLASMETKAPSLQNVAAANAA